MRTPTNTSVPTVSATIPTFDTVAFMTYSRGGLVGHAAAIIGPLGSVQPVVGVGGEHLTQLGYAMRAYRDMLRRLPVDDRNVVVIVAEDLFPDLVRKPPLVTFGTTSAGPRLDRKLSTELTTSLAAEIAMRPGITIAPVKSNADDTGLLTVLFNTARDAVEDTLADAPALAEFIGREKAAKAIMLQEDAKLTDASVTWRDWDRMASRLEDLKAGRDPDTVDGSPRRHLRGAVDDPVGGTFAAR